MLGVSGLGASGRRDRAEQGGGGEESPRTQGKRSHEENVLAFLGARLKPRALIPRRPTLSTLTVRSRFARYLHESYTHCQSPLEGRQASSSGQSEARRHASSSLVHAPAYRVSHPLSARPNPQRVSPQSAVLAHADGMHCGYALSGEQPQIAPSPQSASTWQVERHWQNTPGPPPTLSHTPFWPQSAAVEHAGSSSPWSQAPTSTGSHSTAATRSMSPLSHRTNPLGAPEGCVSSTGLSQTAGPTFPPPVVGSAWVSAPVSEPVEFCPELPSVLAPFSVSALPPDPDPPAVSSASDPQPRAAATATPTIQVPTRRYLQSIETP